MPTRMEPGDGKSSCGKRGGGVAKVLVADDDHLVTWSISRLLSREGYQVQCVDSLAGARKAAEEAEFDLIITDLVFPEGQSLALLGYLGQSQQRVPVILMTGHGSPEVERAARAIGVDAFLEKPFPMEALKRLVRQAIASPPPSPPKPGTADRGI